MQSKKKMIVNTVFLVVIFALTIYGVFHGEDLGAMMEAMRRADVRWLLPGLFCVVFFIWGESIIIWYMMHSFQIPVKRRTCFLFSSVGFFFSCFGRRFGRNRCAVNGHILCGNRFRRRILCGLLRCLIFCFFLQQLLSSCILTHV